MKKITKKLAAFMMILCMLTLVGCGGNSGEKAKPVTAESLVKEMNDNMKSVKSLKGNLLLDMNMGVNSMGISMDMDVSMEGEFESVTDPAIVHMNMTMSMKSLGMSVDMESYVAADEKEVTTYTGVAGQWTKTVAPVGDEIQIQEMYAMFGDGTDFTLAKETEDLNGKEVYVLTAAATGAELESVFGQMGMGDLIGNYGEMDMSQMTVEVQMKVYKDTVLPAYIGITMSGEGLSAEADGAEVTIGGFTMETTYDAFNEIKKIEIPEEALAAEQLVE